MRSRTQAASEHLTMPAASIRFCNPTPASILTRSQALGGHEILEASGDEFRDESRQTCVKSV